MNASRAVASVLRTEYLRAYAAQYQLERNVDRQSRRESRSAAAWLIREVLAYVEPPQAVNVLPAMPKRRPVLHLRSAR